MAFFEMQPKADADFVIEQIRRNLERRPPAPGGDPRNGERDVFEAAPPAEFGRHLAAAEANQDSGIPLPGTRLGTVKNLVGRAVRPFTSRQAHFNASVLTATRLLGESVRALETDVSRRLSDLQLQVAAFGQRQADWLEDLAAVRAQLESQGQEVRGLAQGASSVERRVDGVENWVKLKAEQVDRLEATQQTLRMELFFELRSLLGLLRPTEKPPRIVNDGKYRRMLAEGDLRVNVGAGHLPSDRYLNVDKRPLPGIDVVADVRDLPFDAESVAEMYAAHVIEHFPLDEARNTLVPHWRRLLAAGGRLVIICPDWEAMLSAYAAGSYSFDDLRLATFGAQEYEGDTHFNMYTPDSLTRLLEGAGFTLVNVREKGRRNGACFEMEVEAVK